MLLLLVRGLMVPQYSRCHPEGLHTERLAVICAACALLFFLFCFLEEMIQDAVLDVLLVFQEAKCDDFNVALTHLITLNSSYYLLI